MKKFLTKHWQLIVNWIVFISLARWIIVKALGWHERGELLQFVELTFIAHMALLLLLVVIRTRHVAIDRNGFHQVIALAAFFSGLAFFGEKTTDVNLILSARIVTIAALVLGIMTQINLGRSFGILIARRKIKTAWLYGIIRHPMYFTDILFKVGMVLKMPSLTNAGVLALGLMCYVYRAMLEEKFLSGSDEYREYMKRVKYRLIPGVF